MRGVAAMLVFFGHVLIISHPQEDEVELLGHPIADTGLVVFFLISGFLLYRPFLAARGNRAVGDITPRYLLRRAVRILPAYWVALTVCEVWLDLPGVFSDHWWVSYGLLQSWTTEWQLTGLGVAWSLGVEVTFYLALPLFALFLQNRGAGGGRGARGMRVELTTLGTLVIFGILFHSTICPDLGFPQLVQTLPATIQWFALGMFLAVLEMAGTQLLPRIRERLSDPLVCWTIAAAAFALIASEWIGDIGLPDEIGETIELVLYGIVAVGLLAPAVLSDGLWIVRRLFANRVLLYLGTVSYGIYLYHLPIVFHFYYSDFISERRFQTLTVALVVFAASVALGSASWYLVERPLMRLVHSVKGMRGGVEAAKRSGSEGADAAAGPVG
jgi:peptidoglycan/LPS O-acetylase OafA/YrhL